MDYRAVFEITSSGMNLEKRRLEATALNLANMHATRPAGTEPFRPVRVVGSPVQAEFAALISSVATQSLAVQPRTTEVLPQAVQPRLARDPGHPHADEEGMVKYPGVEHAQEMVTAMSAMRAYEANIAAAGMARSMALRALEIGGQ
jgi:flagellar basal-body rod protein FlgC